MNEHFLRAWAEQKADDWRREADCHERARLSRSGRHGGASLLRRSLGWLAARGRAKAPASGALPVRPMESSADGRVGLR